MSSEVRHVNNQDAKNRGKMWVASTLRLLSAAVLAWSLSIHFATADESSSIPFWAIDPQLLDKGREEFQTSSDGLVVDGPRENPESQIDFFAITKKSLLFDLFWDAINGCKANVAICPQGVFRTNRSRIDLNFTIVKSDQTHTDAEPLIRKAEYFFARAGLFSGRQPTADTFLMNILIGKTEDLAKIAGARGDEKANAFLLMVSQSALRNQAVRSQIGSCYVSMQKSNASVVDIWIDPRDGFSCLDRSLLAGLGLFPTGSDLATATSVFGRYNSLTLGDRLFLHVLYDPRFPLRGSQDDVRKFFNSYEKANRKLASSWDEDLP